MKKDTGLMLSKIRGPLNNLLDNLSGEHGDYWLKALKKMLRQEEIPEPSAEIIEQIKPLDFRTKSNEKIKEIADYLKKIPTVESVHICEDDDMDLININVYPCLTDFLHKYDKKDSAYFYLKTDGAIKIGGVDLKDTDATYDKWCKKMKPKDGMSLKDFCKALIELGKMYEETVLQIKY